MLYILYNIDLYRYNIYVCIRILIMHISSGALYNATLKRLHVTGQVSVAMKSALCAAVKVLALLLNAIPVAVAATTAGPLFFRF